MFRALGVDEWLCDALAALSIHEPTPIQRACIPAILQGRDCIGGAKTGSGKTLAFALPIVQQWHGDPYGVYAVVLAPTRELAIQSSEQFTALSRELRVDVVVGGREMVGQAKELVRRPHIVVATPGRLADHIRSSRDVRQVFARCRVLVLDEADRLMEESFARDLEVIMDVMPDAAQRQTLLFTATVTPNLTKLLKPSTFLHDDNEEVRVPPLLEQLYILVPTQVKETYLYTLLTTLLARHSEECIIVFINRTQTVAMLARTLETLGIPNAALHAKLSQRDREASLLRFRASRVRVLLSTDVASRGLDIPAVRIVVNYDLTRNPTDYIHRVGRTARQSHAGQAINFVCQNDVALVEAIEARVGGEKWAPVRALMPPQDTILRHLRIVTRAKRTATLLSDNLKTRRTG